MPSGSYALYVAILSALATGAAYVPVDADDPEERAELVFGEAQVVAIITEKGLVRGPGSSRGWRAGKPTILRTINRYSDWLGWTDAHLTSEQEQKTVMLHDAWNTMLCDAAKANGFVCADIYHAFNGADGTKPSGDLLGPDYTHPSQKGDDLIAQTLISEGFAPIT
jgi:non-ribosomal peptide synthetase component F